VGPVAWTDHGKVGIDNRGVEIDRDVRSWAVTFDKDKQDW